MRNVQLHFSFHAINSQPLHKGGQRPIGSKQLVVDTFRSCVITPRWHANKLSAPSCNRTQAVNQSNLTKSLVAANVSLRIRMKVQTCKCKVINSPLLTEPETWASPNAEITSNAKMSATTMRIGCSFNIPSREDVAKIANVMA